MTNPIADNPTPPYVVRYGTVGTITPNVQILPYDPNRLVLLVTGTVQGSSASLWLGAKSPGGFEFSVTGGIYSEFSFQKHGDICFLPLYTDTMLGGTSFSWMTLSKV